MKLDLAFKTVKFVIDHTNLDERIAQYLSDNGWKDLFTEYEDPVEEVIQLKDSEDMVYVWRMPDAGDDVRAMYSSDFRSEFRDKNKREPKSMHIFIDSLENVEKLPVEDFAEHLEPWMLNRIGKKLGTDLG